MITSVDTNILLDILIPNQIHIKNSLSKLESFSKKSQLIISEIVYAELGSQFRALSDLNYFLANTGIDMVPCNRETLYNASQLWSQFRKSLKKTASCPECGKQITINCPHCKNALNYPKRILNDFIIGAHAMAFSSGLLTRDRGFYRKYFSELEIY